MGLNLSKKFPLIPEECPSTHGGAGYAPDSRYENGTIICGLCGLVIKKPRPIGLHWDGTPNYGDILNAPIPEPRKSLLDRFLEWK